MVSGAVISVIGTLWLDQVGSSLLQEGADDCDDLIMLRPEDRNKNALGSYYSHLAKRIGVWGGYPSRGR